MFHDRRPYFIAGKAKTSVHPDESGEHAAEDGIFTMRKDITGSGCFWMKILRVMIECKERRN